VRDAARDIAVREGWCYFHDQAIIVAIDQYAEAATGILVRDLTAHRTLGLRLDLSDQPEIALVAATHAFAAQIFYLGADAHVVGIQPIKTDLAAHADGIEDTAAGKAWADRHANWARQMPRDVTHLWAFVAELDHDSRMALFAHCVALTVNAVKLPWERRSRVASSETKRRETMLRGRYEINDETDCS
jgi:ParB family chromosome partitioning protein